MVQVIQGYKTNRCSVFKSVELHGSLIQKSKQIGSNFNMLYNVNVIYKKNHIESVYCLE